MVESLRSVLAAAEPAVPAVRGPSSLTLRQKGILLLLAAGMTRREVGEVLRVSEDTIKNHVTAINRKLGTGSVLEALWVVGWINPRL